MRKFTLKSINVPGYLATALALGFGKGTNIIKDVVFARHFGTGDVIESYLIAFGAVAMLYTILTGSVQGAVIPAYLQAYHLEGEEGASKFLGYAMKRVLLMLTIMALLFMVSFPAMVSSLFPEYSGAKRELIGGFARQMGLVIIFLGYSQVMVYVLNARSRFGIPGLVQMSTPLTIAGSVVLLQPVVAFRELGWITLFGAGLEATIVFFIAKSYRLNMSWMGIPPIQANCGLWAQCLFAGASLMFLACNAFVDQIMAAGLGAGSVAILSYASRLILIPLAFAGVFSAVSFPYISGALVSDDWEEFQYRVKKLTQQAVILGFGLIAVFLLLGPLFVRWAYGGGVFSKTDQSSLNWAIVGYSLQIPWYLGAIPIARALNSLKLNRSLMIVGIGNCFVNILGDYWLGKSMGVPGITLCTSVVYFLAFLQLNWIFMKSVRKRWPVRQKGKEGVGA